MYCSFWLREICFLTFEELTSNTEHCMARIFTFLGLEPCRVSSDLKRQNPRPLREKIANLDEVPDFDAIEAASKLVLSEFAPARES